MYNILQSLDISEIHRDGIRHGAVNIVKMYNVYGDILKNAHMVAWGGGDNEYKYPGLPVADAHFLKILLNKLKLNRS